MAPILLNTATRRTLLFSAAATGLAAGYARAAEDPSELSLMMISRGGARPGVSLSADRLSDIMAALHRGQSPDAIAQALGLTADEVRERIGRLEAEGLAHRDAEGRIRPAAPVVTLDDARRYLQPDPGVVAATARLIAERAPRIRRQCETLPGFRGCGFRRASLLLLSDVLLDNWQIGDVEEGFLHAPRPQRKGGRYYFALMARRTDRPDDALGVYGNHSAGGAPGIGVNLYGNRRYHGAANLITLTPADGARLFGLPLSLSAAEVRKTLAQDVLASWQGHGPPPAPRLAGFVTLGLMDPTGHVVVPVMSEADDQALTAIAADFRPALLAVLESHRAALTTAWRASPYADEGVAFEEYAIWWYHLFYTAVTDRLIRGGQIAAPPGNVLTYFTLG